MPIVLEVFYWWLGAKIITCKIANKDDENGTKSADSRFISVKLYISNDSAESLASENLWNYGNITMTKHVCAMYPLFGTLYVARADLIQIRCLHLLVFFCYNYCFYMFKCIISVHVCLIHVLINGMMTFLRSMYTCFTVTELLKTDKPSSSSWRSCTACRSPRAWESSEFESSSSHYIRIRLIALAFHCYTNTGVGSTYAYSMAYRHTTLQCSHKFRPL